MKKITLIGFLALLLFSIPLISVTAQEFPQTEIPVESFLQEDLSPCPNPDREPRFVYREKVVHEERQFRAEHPGCGGDIMMRKWQQVALEAGYCTSATCRDPIWLEHYIQIYDRYTPDKEGEVFEEVGSWQKAWPSSARWLTETELEEEYGEPIPFPTCQSDCLQAPPGVPGQVGDFGQEDPYYFNNPWLPEIIGGEIPERIEDLREKNILGGSRPLNEVRLPVKLFWWNVPGWHEGWIEDGELKYCNNDDPEDIACVNSYIIKFDNINKEDRPAVFHRHEVIHRLIESGYEYEDAQEAFELLERINRESYERYRRYIDDNILWGRDVMRYDRDNIVGCDECGAEKDIWLDTNTFNHLEFSPVYDYERDHRKWMKDYLLDHHLIGDHPDLFPIIEDNYNSYGRPSFFRSGAEHNYSLRAACAPHDYLEEDEGRWGPEANFSFQTSDAPELISPIDPNWTSPYDAKEYDPNFDPTRLKATEYGYDEGYIYPPERRPGIGHFIPDPNHPGGPLIPPPPAPPPTPPAAGEGLIPGPINEDQGMECQHSTLRKRDPAPFDVIDALGIGVLGDSNATVYEKWLISRDVNSSFASQIAWAGGTTVIPPLFEENPTHCWEKILDTAYIVEEIARNHPDGNRVTQLRVNSAYRDIVFNSGLDGSASRSQHMANTAFDVVWYEPQYDYNNDDPPNVAQQKRAVRTAEQEDLYHRINAALGGRCHQGGRGGLAIYNNQARHVHVDTRTGCNRDWTSYNISGKNYSGSYALKSLPASLELRSSALKAILDKAPQNIAEGGEPPIMQEDKSLKNWITSLDEPTSIWSQDPGSLVLQDQVAFRQQLRWAQIWFQPDYEYHPRPAALYRMSFGDGIRVTDENEHPPVLEDCHYQQADSFEGNPICRYSRRTLGGHETRHQYPEPNHIDREMEFFTVPKDEWVDLYSWNISACRDVGERDCTDWSQIWRFQLDGREQEKLAPPRNVSPLNLKEVEVKEDDATVGFPFLLRWDRRFGAKTYVYRVIKTEDENWTDIPQPPNDPIDAGIQISRDVRYTLDDLKEDEDDDEGLFLLDTRYSWDVKSCWDDKRGEELGPDAAPDEILEFAKEEKQCSEWRSNYPNYRNTDAPFEFKTTGRPPKFVQNHTYPTMTDGGEYPIDFQWEAVPGAKSYFLVVCHAGNTFTDKCPLEPGPITIYIPGFGDIEFENESEGDVHFAARTQEPRFRAAQNLLLEEDYIWNVYTCADPVEQWSIYVTDPLFELDTLKDMADLRDDLNEAHCGEDYSVIQFQPHLSGPRNLKPGTDDELNPEVIYPDEPIQLISWDNLRGVENYEIKIFKTGDGQSGPFQEVELISGMVDQNYLTFTFAEPGDYKIEVRGCILLDPNDEDKCAGGRLGHKTVSHLRMSHYPEGSAGGIVPCGRSIDIFPQNSVLDSREDCRPVHLFVMFNRIIEEVLIKLFIPYSLVVLLLYTGFLYYKGLGDPDTMKKVFKVWEAALKGYTLILLSWLIVGVFLSLLGYQYGAWWEITNL